MRGPRPFVFAFDVSRAFLVQSPVASAYVEACKRRIGARLSAFGPRGGLYRLITPPDYWDEYDAHWERNQRTFATRRMGRYVRPDRISPELRIGEVLSFESLTVPAVDGKAVLPSGASVEVTSPYVTFPVLVP